MAFHYDECIITVLLLHGHLGICLFLKALHDVFELNKHPSSTSLIRYSWRQPPDSHPSVITAPPSGHLIIISHQSPDHNVLMLARLYVRAVQPSYLRHHLSAMRYCPSKGHTSQVLLPPQGPHQPCATAPPRANHTSHVILPLHRLSVIRNILPLHELYSATPAHPPTTDFN